ncbi:MAG: hypothetical protein JW724_03350, partial [Candidatus Altiarchaeota archaeon]|nr:hypothetical protein [Candidatus Altiarchaeota archaeon]
MDGRMRAGRSLVALFALTMLLAGFAAAISPGDQFFSLLEEAEYPPKVPVGPALQDLGLILAGTGVASNSTADLPLTLMVENSRVARPSHAKKLIDDLDAIDPSPTPWSGGDVSDYRGQILLFDRPYLLGEIRISGELVVSELEAVVVKRTTGGEVVAGHLSIETERQDRLWDGEGLLSMEDGTIRGDYHVVLDITPQGERSREVPSNDPEPPPDLFRIVSAGS